jgi:acyl-homoserine-lactone acylase
MTPRVVTAALLAALAEPRAGVAQSTSSLDTQVEIIRTTHGVPHIRAGNLTAAYYALAWVQLEDYGANTAFNLLRARGEVAKWFGYDSINGDFRGRQLHARAVETYNKLDPETRQAYEGFAAGVNRYIELHPQEFPPGFAPTFTGYDVAARDVSLASANAANQFLSRLDPSLAGGRGGRGGGGGRGAGRGGGRWGAGAPPPPTAASLPVPRASASSASLADSIEEGSNSWAFAPSRTTSGRAILMRNPHLAWDAGYYEAHMTVPGVIDFYGDFRIGGPFGVIGGFNKDLGWSTTNNAPDLEEIYELTVDPARVDHYLFDGTSIPLSRELISVEWKNGDGTSTETREMWRTPLGPVVHRGDGKIWVVKAAGDGDYQAGEQFLRMMRAKTLDEWKAAMRMRQRVTSNFTYADRAGNILYVWNASQPRLPHPNGGDTTAIPARATSDVWTHYIPWDSLPQFLNPRGGYVHNSNDAPWYGNMQQPLDASKWGPDFPEPPELLLRSQLSIELIDTKRKLSLEDVVKLKNSYRMLLADRVKTDLVSAVRATRPTGDVAAALALIERWDNTAGPASKGAVLFQTWWQRYTRGAPVDSAYARPWSMDAPTTTPAGLRNRERAAEEFAAAVPETAERYGAFDVAWGDVHRVRIGATDVPVGGCGGALGCFRVLNFRTDPDGKRAVTGGDGWVLAVEFGADAPRAYSVLAYGNSNREESRWYGDQAEMFATGEVKKVLFLPADVDAHVVQRYRPGAPR